MPSYSRLSFHVPRPEVVHQPALVRRYLLQSLLRNAAGIGGVWVCIGLPLALLVWQAGEVWPHSPLLWLALALCGSLLGSLGMARHHLAELGAEGQAISADWMAAALRHELASPFDPITTFDLCTDALSGLAAGTALGYGGPAAFGHDPFRGRLTLGQKRPWWLWGCVEVQVIDGGATARIVVRRRPGLQALSVQRGEALKAVRTVLDLIGERLRQRSSALEAARRERELERSALYAKLGALQAQVEPHFLFNTLANLKYLIRTDSEAAQHMLDHLVGYLQNALPGMRSVSSTLGRELELVRDYLSIMRIRMGQRLSFEIDAPPELLALPMPPAMLISLVENAIKHGLERASRPGMVRIVASARDGLLRLAVCDNGVGLTEQMGQGLGLANLHERLALLYGGRAALAVSGGAESGVEAVLTLPLEGGA